MAQRKEVFQSKVMRKLYPATPTPGKKHSPPHTAEATQVKRKSCGNVSLGNTGKTKNAANPRGRMYTVLPPPPGYNTRSEISVTLPQLESINSAEDPADENIQESSEELEEEEKGAEGRKRRKKRKRKSTPQNSEKDGTVLSESSTGPSQAHADEGGESFSKNKRRKLKKKRHKEKLMSMGLMPRAAALEFTYHKDEEEKEEEEEEEDNKRRAAELSDFLRTTTEIYMSDSSLHVKVPHLCATVDALLDSIMSGRKPNSVLKQLCCLKTFAQRNETDSLERALEELNNLPSMSIEETSAIVSLFKYWITDILPMHKDKKTQLSTAQP